MKGDINMNYEIVILKEKTVVGISARTNNFAPDMGEIIGGLWNRFYNEGIYNSIPDKTNNKALGIYTDYDDDKKDNYTVLVACEVNSNPENNDSFFVSKIPEGRYAKFIVKGNMYTAVENAWQKIWQMNLPRTFVCDFEEYQNCDMNNAEIHIYIGIESKEEK